MVLTYETIEHSASISNATTLQPISAGNDINGNDRYIYAVSFQDGADLQRVQLNSNSWGNRVPIDTPPIGEGGLIDGNRTHFLRYLEKVDFNQSVDSSGLQDSVGAQTVEIYVHYLVGEVPSAVLTSVAKATTLFFTGTAQNGSFPAPGAFTNQQRVLDQSDGILWNPVEATILGTGDPLAQFKWDSDGGEGPQVAGFNDVYQRRPWMPLPAIQKLKPGDFLKLLGQDQSASTITAIVNMIKDENTPTRSPFDTRT